MGDAVNLAARLKEACEFGQIFVGATTDKLTAPFFHSVTRARLYRIVQILLFSTSIKKQPPPDYSGGGC